MRGHRGRSRGRGGSRGRGHHKGQGQHRGQGRRYGSNRELFPSRDGFLFRLESNVDENDDDFRIYGQFSSDEQEAIQPQKQKKKQLQHLKKNEFIRPTKEQKKSLYLEPLKFNKSSDKKEITEELDEATLTLAELSLSNKQKGESSKDAVQESDSDEIFEQSDFEEGSDFESEEEDYSYRHGYLDDTEEDEQLEEDLLVMEDYIENLVLDSDENLEDLIAWSEMQTNEELEDDVYDYATLDEPKESRMKRIMNEMEEEEEMMTQENIHKKIIKSSKKKPPVKDKVVDPEIFGQTLQAALAQVPPSLRPGMRAWYEKQQRREENVQNKSWKDRKKEPKENKDRKDKKDKKGKNKDKGGKTKEELGLEKIDRRLRDFVQDDTITCFEFAPMSGVLRKHIHILSQAYNLHSKGTGHHEGRYVVVRKTAETCLPKNRNSIERYISQMQQSIEEHTRITQKQHSYKEKKQPKNTKMKDVNTKTDKKKSNKPTHGAVVAHDAAPIGESNVGHRMLAAMGWQQGQALGTSNNGITAPIEAVIRRDKLGLGL